MRDLSKIISGSLLPRVSRPSQYVGLEINARRKDMASAQVAIALAFPDTYAVGISHLGSQILYQMLNDTPGVAADRTYCPQLDAQEVMRELDIPLFGWESRASLADFDAVGFSLPYEMCCTNVLTMLDLAGLPLRSAERRQGQPIILAGDALADSPEPMADFIDVFLVGDGELPLAQFAQLLMRMKQAGAAREDILLEAARTIPSAYVPRFYRPGAGSAGLYVPRPARADVPATISRAHLHAMSDSPAYTSPLVPLAEAVHERVVIEIMRGCPNGCRFCQAGATRLPVRWRSVEEILQMAQQAIDATGYSEISLLSLSTGDYPRLDELIEALNSEFAPRKVSISLPSLRVDQQLAALPKLTSTVRKSGLTIAAEAGSDRLRRAIRKDITEQDMLAAVRAAYQAGYRSVKVYFMAGLPGESEGDIDAIFDLCRRLSDERRAVDGQRGSISASVSWFVPKPHTPMQWCAMGDADYFFSVRRRLKDLAYRSPVSFKFHRIERSILECLIARGDRRVGATIEAAFKAGARLDSWDEHFDYAKWLSAMEQTGVGLDEYVHRELDVAAELPWSHIIPPRPAKFLHAEYDQMRNLL